VLTTEDGQQEVRQIASVARSDLRPETLGLTLAEAKTMLKDLQQLVVERQTSAHLASQQRCPDCDQSRSIKGYHDLALRTLFGKLTIKSPRLHHCPCRPHKTKTFSPLAELLPQHTSPELLFLETKWASLASYGLTATLLADVLPMDEPLSPFTIRHHLFAAAQRLERALGEEHVCFIEGCPGDWERLPIPDGPLTVGVDGALFGRRASKATLK
jgi:hypothetical protein